MKAVEWDSRPIGVFDSGVGGLTVLRALRARLPHEHLIYLGDTAHVPYGTKSRETVVRYALENTIFLTSKNIKALVIACNTSSAYSLDRIRATFNLPVVGVIEPGVRKALADSRRGRIGVIGTSGTIASGAYQKSLKRLSPNVRVVAKACPLFVALAEEGWTDGNVARGVAAQYLMPLRRENLDTIILGCTHYPLLKRTIQMVMGPRVTLIDSAKSVAEEVVSVLHSRRIGADPGRKGKTEIYATDIGGSFGTVAEKFLGKPIARVKRARVFAVG